MIRQDVRHFLRLFLIILLTGGFIIVGSHVLDAIFVPENQGRFPLFYLFTSIDTVSVQNYVGSLAEVITGLFGIIITVVAIIVNLSANRYTSKIVELFIRDRLNQAVLIFFAVICLTGIWVSNMVQNMGGPAPFYPKYGILIYLSLLSLGILLVVPYFFYVFNFLKPNNIIKKIEKQACNYIQKAAKPNG